MTGTVRATVVMSAFNAGRTIGDALESYRSQTVDDIEIMVFDDGSTDDTAAVVRAIDDPRIRLLGTGTNVGRSIGRDTCVRSATSDVIVVADADDIAHAHRIAAHLRVLSHLPDAVATFGRLRELRPSGPVVNERFPDTPDAVDAMFRRGQMPVAHPASAFRRDWYLSVGGYDPEIRWCEDYDLFARGWTPGSVVPDATVLLDYAIDGVVRPWTYWWHNERHRTAVNARIADAGPAAGTTPFAPYLAASSTIARRVHETARWAAVSARDTALACRAARAA